MNMSTKKPSLHKRLNDLENELKELHDRMLKKRTLSNQKYLQSHTKLNSKKTVQKKRTQFFTAQNALNHYRFGNTIYDPSANHKKDAIGRATSLTEITSLSSGLNKVLRTIKKNEAYNACTVQEGKQIIHKKKSKLVQNYKLGNECIRQTLSNVLVHKPQKITMKETSSDLTGTTPNKQTAKTKTALNFESIDRDVEDQMLDLKMLKEHTESVKKKLRDERTKREIAERAVVGYKRRLAILEGKNGNTEEKGASCVKEKTLADLFASIQKQLQEEYSLDKKVDQNADDDATRKTLASLEKELNGERTKRLEAEKLVTELKNTLEESQKTIIKLEEGRKLAVAMADQFREKATDNNTKEIEKLKAEKAALEMELKYSKTASEVSPDIVKILVERAEQAEKELFEKMKQCNNFLAKSSLNDPQVVKLLEKHKKAYAELQLEKKNKEIELKKRCNALLKDIKTTGVTADKRYKEISEKYTESISILEKKEEMINTMKNEKKVIENELRNLKLKLQEVGIRKDQQEELIISLKDAVKSNEEQVEKTKKENIDFKEKYVFLEAKYNKLHNSLKEQDKIIEKLRAELEEKKDSIKIKDKMLQDQGDTIKCLRTVADNTKKSLDEERIKKCRLMDDLNKLENSRDELNNKLASMEQILKKAEDERTKENLYLKQLESKVRQKHTEWQQQIIQVSYEKEKAIETARFATEKLVKAVNGYENKLGAQKKIHELLDSALKEKEYQLQIAKQQVQDLNEEVWKSAQMTEKVRNELQTKLKKACEVCTDVIDTQMELDV